MIGQSFRFHSPILAITRVDGKELTLSIPEGASVTVAENKEPSSTLVAVIWETQEALVFEHDLRERAELVDSASAS
jgi:hypothetical protein